MKLYADKLSSHLQKSLAPCYLVSGDEQLLLNEALDEIRAAARKRGFESREVHVATTGFNWSQLASAGANLSLFADKRIVELRLPTGKPGREGSAAICDFIANLGPELMLIVITPKLDGKTTNTKWAKALNSEGAFLPIWPIGLRELPGWIANRMRRAGLQPEREAYTMIADRVEGNLLAADQEIEKLRLIMGEGPVTGEDVRRAVANSSRYDVYKLIDAAVAGNGSRTMKILNGLHGEGVEPVIMVWALTRELRMLAKLADCVSQNGDLGAAMKREFVWQNRQGMVRACVRRHTRDEFYRLLKLTGRADAAAKGQAAGDAWQLAADILLDLSLGESRAA